MAESTDRLRDLRKAVANGRKADAPPRVPNAKSTRRGADNGSGGGACSYLKSFGGDTPVLMADGTHKPIKDIKVGDKVLATDPETGEQAAKAVTHLWVHYDNLTELILDVDADGDGNPDRLVTTEDHPFWNATDQAWEGPLGFDDGDQAIDDEWNRITVVGLDHGTTHRALAYNLTVDGIHTYHVGDGRLLVHNIGADCPNGPSGGGSTGARSPEAAGMSSGTAAKIQQIATNTRQRITVVGSRAAGTAGHESDWDFILSGASRARRKAAMQLPRGRSGGGMSIQRRMERHRRVAGLQSGRIWIQSLGSQPSARDLRSTGVTTMKWEYTSVGVDGWLPIEVQGEVKARLTALGEAGWEAFAVTPQTPPDRAAMDPDQTSYEILLKRLKGPTGANRMV